MTPTRLRRGEVSTPPDDTPAPCYPSRRTPECDGCARLARIPLCRRDLRRQVVIDASALNTERGCGMYAPIEWRKAA